MYCVLFDIDGTLLHSGGAGKRAFGAAFAEMFDIPKISDRIPFAGRSDRAIVLDFMNEYGIEPSNENWRRFVDAYLRHLDGLLPQCEGEVFPGVVSLLDTIREMEHASPGILTGNIQAGAARKLEHYGLAHHFEYGGFGDESTDRNAIAQAAKEQAEAFVGGEIFGVMVIGDTIHDVRCAKSIGAFSVAVATGGVTRDELAASNPDLLIDDLTDTDALLAEIAAVSRRDVDLTTRS